MILLATLYVGYKVNESYKNGAIHGALVGIVGGITGSVIIGILYLVGLGDLAKQLWPVTSILVVIIAIIIYAIIGANAGSIGSKIKK